MNLKKISDAEVNTLVKDKELTRKIQELQEKSGLLFKKKCTVFVDTESGEVVFTVDPPTYINADELNSYVKFVEDCYITFSKEGNVRFTIRTYLKWPTLRGVGFNLKVNSCNTYVSFKVFKGEVAFYMDVFSHKGVSIFEEEGETFKRAYQVIEEGLKVANSQKKPERGVIPEKGQKSVEEMFDVIIDFLGYDPGLFESGDGIAIPVKVEKKLEPIMKRCGFKLNSIDVEDENGNYGRFVEYAPVG